MFSKLCSIIIVIFPVFILGACSIPEQAITSKSKVDVSASIERHQGMGPGSRMMDRHHGQVPEPFAGLTNPVASDDESLERGQEIYTTHCATCHGDYGNGDGSGGVSLDPLPAPIAHTSQMMGDAYLFWRITEGGVPFETGMLPYRDILDEGARWDVINYVRALGSGLVQPGQHMGGDPFDPALEQVQRNDMMALAVEQGVITQFEADIFDQVHTSMDEFLVGKGPSGMNTGPRADALEQILVAMVDGQLVTQERANTFIDVHNRLIEADLMQ